MMYCGWRDIATSRMGAGTYSLSIALHAVKPCSVLVGLGGGGAGSGLDPIAMAGKVLLIDLQGTSEASTLTAGIAGLEAGDLDYLGHGSVANVARLHYSGPSSSAGRGADSGGGRRMG